MGHASLSTSSDGRGPALAALLLAACGGSPAEHARPAGPPNVVLVVLDTLRRDACSAAASGAPVEPALAPQGGATPTLARLAREAAVFTQATSGAAWTVPSHASMFTGLLPHTHRCVASSARLGPVGPTLAEVLAGCGYETAAFFSNPWLSDGATGLLRGFATRAESRIGGLGELVDPTRGGGDQGGEATLGAVERWLDRRDPSRPFFLFVNFLEAHLPYDPPAAVRARCAPPLPPGARTSIEWAHEFNAGLHPAESVDWDAVRRTYAADVRAVDDLLGRLWSALERRGVLDGAAWVITSDHGENLGDHGWMEHQFSLHESLLGVPLLVHLPGDRLPAGLYERPVSTLDVYATLAALVGEDPGASRPYSVALQAPPPVGERPIFSDYLGPHPGLVAMLRGLNPALDGERLAQAWRGVRSGDLRLSASSSGTVLLHDLAADPGQTHDLSQERPRVVGRLMKLLQESQAEPREASGGQAAPMDEETARRLRELGYAAGDPSDPSATKDGDGE